MKKKAITLTRSDVESLIDSIDRYVSILKTSDIDITTSALRQIVVAQVLHQVANRLTIMHRNGSQGKFLLKSYEAIALYELSMSHHANWSDSILIQKQITP